MPAPFPRGLLPGSPPVRRLLSAPPRPQSTIPNPRPAGKDAKTRPTATWFCVFCAPLPSGASPMRNAVPTPSRSCAIDSTRTPPPAVPPQRPAQRRKFSSDRDRVLRLCPSPAPPLARTSHLRGNHRLFRPRQLRPRCVTPRATLTRPRRKRFVASLRFPRYTLRLAPRHTFCKTPVHPGAPAPPPLPFPPFKPTQPVLPNHVRSRRKTRLPGRS